MKINNLLLGAAFMAAMGFTSCSNEEPVNNGGSDNGTKSTFFVSVMINDAGASRASEGGYEDAVAGEHEVSTADFYFYDENGIFVSKSSAWDGKDFLDDPDDNINFKSKMVVVLKDLDKKGYPKYMVTILNQPTGFATPQTMAEMEKALSNASLANGIVGDSNHFVMSTTSFRGENTNKAYYFATELTEENFAKDVKAAEYTTPAVVYVERLAVRVKLGFADSAGFTQNADGTYTKKVKITLAGNLNTEDDEIDDNIGAEYIYIHMLGWDLNATAKNSYMVKNINYAAESNPWDAFNGFVWNNKADHRSFWGKSFNYGDAAALYPANDGDVDEDLLAADWTPGTAGYPLKYIAYGNIATSTATNKTFDKPLYCAENTNTSAIVSANGQAITSVVLKAVISSDEAGESPVDLIRYRGVLYVKDHYINHMLSILNNVNNLNYYYKVEVNDETTEYYQINKDYVKLVDATDGLTALEPADNFVEGSIYKKVSDKVFEVCSAEEIAKFATDLAALNNTKAGGYTALAYTGGKMYYNIPIEHLATNTASDGKISEAVYGVVRNHSYQITVNKVDHIGQGVFDPDKQIIVDEPTPENELWSVGATINILSWKLVNQGVDL